ncbi:helix-turn-helix domain-containing protein [Streptomyces sp. AA1529]|uniref:helix-turn-helix domain-containing protein n=1 Tax=Streptomyces sp. AA1529 TaxID=1203257 RepID=UPI003D729DEE
MPGPKDIDGSAGVPTFYGKELRWKREQAGLTQPQLVEGSFYGHSHLSEIERGERRMPPDLAAHVDKVLKTDGFFSRRCEDVRNARRRGHAPYFERVLETEVRAESIEEWCPTLIPGLVQTEPYIRAVIRATHPFEAAEKVQAKVDGRLGRAQLLGPDGPMVWIIMHESVLRQRIISGENMAAQLNHIAELTERRYIVPQVIPWNSGAHPLMQGTAKIVTFPDAPPLAYTESPYSGHTIDEPATVKKYAQAYDFVRASAMSPAASLTMLRRVAEDHRSDRQPSWTEHQPVAQE